MVAVAPKSNNFRNKRACTLNFLKCFLFILDTNLKVAGPSGRAV